MQNYKKDLFPADIIFERYPFKDGEVLSASQLESLQQNIENTFNQVENFINIISDKTSEGILEKYLGFKGIVNCDQLEAISSAENGFTYILKDTSAQISYLNEKYGISFKNNELIICTKSFNLSEVSSKNFIEFKDRWFTKDNIFETDTYNNPGLISTGLQYIVGLKKFMDGLTVRGDEFTIDVNKISITENGKSKLLIDDDFLNYIDQSLKDINNKIESLSQFFPISTEEINNLFL